MDNSKLLYCLLGALGVNRLCSLVPAYHYFDPFPFYEIVDANGVEIGITVQSYIYGISVHLFVMILFYLLVQISNNKLFYLFGTLFWLEVLSLVDYLLIYEHPIFHLGSYGVEFTDFKIILYTYFIIRWNQQT